MKQRIFLSAVLIWSVVNGFAQIGQAGQKVVTGSQWNIGWGQFEAHVKPALIQSAERSDSVYLFCCTGRTGRGSADRASGCEGGAEEPGGSEGADLLR